jgi:hypothetical protein
MAKVISPSAIAPSPKDLGIGPAQSKLEKTPEDGIAPPTATGSYQVDPSVIAGTRQSQIYSNLPSYSLTRECFSLSDS